MNGKEVPGGLQGEVLRECKGGRMLKGKNEFLQNIPISLRDTTETYTSNLGKKNFF